MVGQRRKVLGHVVADLGSRMNRIKKMPGGEALDTRLSRCLNTFDITLLGIGHMIGAGIYVLTGTVARDIAGPGIVLSFLLAGLTSLLAALCYAELGARVPRAGSAYAYIYCTIGEFWAFFIGWNIILEHMIGAASVARAWSAYLDAAADGALSRWMSSWVGNDIDILAAVVCLLFSGLLGVGVKTSAVINSAFTLVTLAVMITIISIGFYFADITNWTNDFLPYGTSGVLAGAATCFYAFVGFDSIATSGEEAVNPAFSIPVATAIAMITVTLGYMLVSSALTLMTPFAEIDAAAAFPQAFGNSNIPWLKYVVSVGALCGMSTTLLGSLYSLPRCIYAMASDGLLFSFLGNVNERTKIPLSNLAVSALMSAVIALIFDLKMLVEFMSIGTLLAYTLVSASVIVLRYSPEPISSEDVVSLAGRLKPKFYWLRGIGGCPPAIVFIFTCCSAALSVHIHLSITQIYDSDWFSILLLILLGIILILCKLVGINDNLWGTVKPFFFGVCSGMVIIGAHEQSPGSDSFQVPFVPVLPCLSILCNIALIVHLKALTWIRFLVWMTLGLMVYFLYGIRHSKEGDLSYSGLLTSAEASKGVWGAVTGDEEATVVHIKATNRRSNATDEDKAALIDEDD